MKYGHSSITMSIRRALPIVSLGTTCPRGGLSLTRIIDPRCVPLCAIKTSSLSECDLASTDISPR